MIFEQIFAAASADEEPSLSPDFALAAAMFLLTSS
jgi:hypothetical protein